MHDWRALRTVVYAQGAGSFPPTVRSGRARRRGVRMLCDVGPRPRTCQGRFAVPRSPPVLPIRRGGQG
eukprot:1289975-Pleurochrysis_carterae.AAC.1